MGSTGSLEKNVKIGSTGATGSLRQKANQNVMTGSTGSEGKTSPSNVKATGGGSLGQKNIFIHSHICCSPAHPLSKMGSLASQLQMVAEI